MSRWSWRHDLRAIVPLLGLGCGGKFDFGESGANHDAGQVVDAAQGSAVDAASSPSDGADGRMSAVDELRFRKIAAGSTRYCGITEPDARLVCVKDERTIFVDRKGPYIDLSMSEEHGWDYACAVRASGELECVAPSVNIEPPAGAYSQVSVGFFDACAVKTDGTVACWLPIELGGVEPPADLHVIQPIGEFGGATLSVNMWHGCAIAQAFHLVCFAGNVASPGSDHHFFALAVAPKGGCGLTLPDEEIWCWTDSDAGLDTGEKMLEGRYQSLAVNLDREGCGVTKEGEIRCWGRADYTPPTGTDGPFQSISIGGFHVCALRTDGKVACWQARLG